MTQSCRQRHVGVCAIKTGAGVLISLVFCVCVYGIGTAAPMDFTGMEKSVAAASRPSPAWDGPRSGPAGMAGKKIAMLCEDLRNGGILGVAQGVQEAGDVIGWQISVFDAGGTPGGRARAAADAIAGSPDGFILVGADANVMAPMLVPLAKQAVPMVGWHVGPKAGPMADSPVAVNISTDPLEVARITALAAVADSGGKACVVIFTDSNFKIATAKANAMAQVIKSCKDCTLLQIRDVAISRSPEVIPKIIQELIDVYGNRWTHALAINDIYFDYAVPELIKAGEVSRGICFLSAGDGSPSAFMRIQAGVFQTGTVAEPLNLHGWQLADELNRLMANKALSGYIAPVHLVTPENIMYDGGPELRYDPDNGYREIYKKIWKGQGE